MKKMNKDTSDVRIYLVAEATRKNPTGYHATFHEASRVTPFPIDSIDPKDIAFPVISEEIVMVRKNSPKAGVSNMSCLYLSGKSLFTDVAFLYYDPETRLLSLPTLEQLKDILDALYLVVDPDAPGNIVCPDMTKDDTGDYDYDCLTLPPSVIPKIAPQTLDLFADLDL